MTRDLFQAAKTYALNLLSRRAYTEKGLYDKLLTRFDEEVSAAAVARMIELNLLDDEDYAMRRASDLFQIKQMPKKRIALELSQKGIDGAVIYRVLEEFDDNPELQIAKIITKKYMRHLGDEKGRAKVKNALMRKGFGYGDISAVIRHLDEDASYYEDWEE